MIDLEMALYKSSFDVLSAICQPWLWTFKKNLLAHDCLFFFISFCAVIYPSAMVLTLLRGELHWA